MPGEMTLPGPPEEPAAVAAEQQAETELVAATAKVQAAEAQQGLEGDEAAIEAAAAELAAEEASAAAESIAAVDKETAAEVETAVDPGSTDERVAEPTALELELMARVDVLERTAAAEQEERASRRLAKLSNAELPVASLQEALLHFRRPFASSAVRWKLQSVWKSYKGGIVVGYIDARLVVERLNAVWPWWEDAYDNAGNAALRCHLTMLDIGQMVGGAPMRITRSDVGVSSGGEQALKGANSDAFKRAAVRWGVGVSVYAMRAITMRVGEGDAELRTREKTIGQGEKRKTVLYPELDARNEERLQRGYERWLAAKGVPLFGPVLDHGDELGAGGLEESVPATVDGGQEREEADVAHADAEAGDGPVLGDQRAKQLVAKIEETYKVVRARAPRKMVPAAFRAKLNKASRESHEALEELLQTLEAIVESAG